MSKTIAVFGAGTGLGISTTRRFGREGYQVALVGRRAPAPRTLVEQLMEVGISAARARLRRVPTGDVDRRLDS